MATPIQIREYETRRVRDDELSRELVERLHERHRKCVSATRRRSGWTLRGSGWIGHLPLSPDVSIHLAPKTPIANVFRMLELSYDLGSLEMLDGEARYETIDDLFDRLAEQLAHGVTQRVRRGVHRSYRACTERLPYLRGRLRLGAQLRRAHTTDLACRYEDHTTDVEENRILAWTLERLVRSRRCGDRVAPMVRRALRAIRPFVTMRPVSAEACVGRVYDRLTEDYRPLHALCRFFLENLGPAHVVGTYLVRPFLVSMPHLFERFVDEWLRRALPPNLELVSQSQVQVGIDGQTLKVRPDLVLKRREVGSPRHGEVLAVLDAKYKITGDVARGDFYQIMTATELHGCNRAALIYPVPVRFHHSQAPSRIEMKALAFELAGDLRQAGERLLREILAFVDVTRPRAA